MAARQIMCATSASAARIGWRSSSTAPAKTSASTPKNTMKASVTACASVACGAPADSGLRGSLSGCHCSSRSLRPHISSRSNPGRSGVSLTMRIASSGQASTQKPQKMQRE